MRNKLILLFEAVFYYIIYLISGIVGNIISVALMAIIIGFEYLSNNMLTNNMEFFEKVISSVQTDVSLGIFCSLVFVLLAYWVAFKNRKRNLAEYAGMKKSSCLGIFAAAVSGVLAYMLVNVFMENYVMQTNVGQQYNEHMSWVSEGNVFVTFIVIAILAPVVEEIVFRGVLISSFQKVITPIGALLVTSLLFAVAHGNPVQGAYSFVLGLVLAYIRIRSGSLWHSIAMHISFNCSNVVLAVLGVKPTVLPVLISILLFAFFAWIAGYPCRTNKVS